MTTLLSHRASDAFLELALAGERRQAVGLTLDLLDEGFSLPAVLDSVVGVAQREMGRRWQHAEVSVADEHLVTGISQAALTAISANDHRQAAMGTVVVACAEGDWHALPSQMFAESLRAAGQGVLHLGASVPAADVAMLLERRRPEALLVTCSLPLSYLGVASLAEAAHRTHTPVLAGGGALNAARACNLGADAWAADVTNAVEILTQWRSDPPEVGAHPIGLEPAAVLLDRQARVLADRAMSALTEGSSAWAGEDDQQQERMRADLVAIVRFLAAARVVDDDEVFGGFSSWLQEVHSVRDVPVAALVAGLAALAPLVREIDERGAALAEAAAARLG